MEITALISILGALVTIGGLFIQWRKANPEIKVANSQAGLNEAQTAGEIVEAAENAMAVLKNALQYSEEARKKEREELSALVKTSTDALLKASVRENEYADRITELERQQEEFLTNRREREERLSRAEERIEDLGRQVLNSESSYNTLKAEYDTLMAKYNNLLEVFAKWLKDKNGEVPKDIADELGDSVKIRLGMKK